MTEVMEEAVLVAEDIGDDEVDEFLCKISSAESFARRYSRLFVNSAKQRCILVTGQHVTNSEIHQLESYLLWKYGVSLVASYT